MRPGNSEKEVESKIDEWFFGHCSWVSLPGFCRGAAAESRRDPRGSGQFAYYPNSEATASEFGFETASVAFCAGTVECRC